MSSKQLVPSTCDVTDNVCHGLWVPSGSEGKLFRSGRCSYLCRGPQLPRAGVTNLRINQRASATTQMVTQRRVWPAAGVLRAEQLLNWEWPVTHGSEQGIHRPLLIWWRPGTLQFLNNNWSLYLCICLSTSAKPSALPSSADTITSSVSTKSRCINIGPLCLQLPVTAWVLQTGRVVKWVYF